MKKQHDQGAIVGALIFVCFVFFLNIMGWIPLAWPATPTAIDEKFEIIKEADKSVERGAVKVKYTYTILKEEFYTLDELDIYIQYYQDAIDKNQKLLDELKEFRKKIEKQVDELQ